MKTYPLLLTYDSVIKENLDALVDKSIRKLPYTLAFPIQKIVESIEDNNFSSALTRTLEFFELSSQYISFLLYTFLEEKEPDIQSDTRLVLERIVRKIDQKRPLSFGDWTNDILLPLYLTATNTIPENPLIQTLRKFVITPKSNLYTGDKHNESLVKIRNEHKGHGITMSNTFYKRKMSSLEERFLKLLKGLEPLTEWEFIACSLKNKDNTRIIQLNGTLLIQKTEWNAEFSKWANSLEQSHYYILYPTKDKTNNYALIDLFPFAFCSKENFVYLFQTLKDENIFYISSNENAETYSTETYNEAFDIRLKKIVPSFDIAKDLNWDEIRDLAIIDSRNFLKNVYDEKKYNREMFVDRPMLTELFCSFIKSDMVLFPLLGEAGQGKTNQLCYWTEQLVEQEKCVFFFSSSQFTDITLEEKIRQILRISHRRKIQQVLDTLETKAEEQNEHICFIFDAINECLMYKGDMSEDKERSENGPTPLFSDIMKMLILPRYNNLKVLITCRNYTWKNQILPQVSIPNDLIFKIQDEKEICIRGFQDDELKQAYSIYRHLFQMETPFEALHKNVIIRLKDPLILKITCTNFMSSDLLAESLPYTSIALFDKMFRDIAKSYAGKSQCEILRGISRVILESYEKGIPSNSVKVDDLRHAYKDKENSLHQLAKLIYHKENPSIAYGELLNKPERPVLRLLKSSNPNNEGSIQFIYERFMEYMLARVYTEREITNLSESQNLPASIVFEELERSATNVVFIGVMSNVLIMDYLRTKCCKTLIDLIVKYGENYEVSLLITEVLNVLTKENYQDELFQLLHTLINTQIENGDSLITEFNELTMLIGKNQADSTTIKRYNELSSQLAPQFRLRKLASICIFKGVFLSEYFNERLYSDKPLELVWQLITDSINEVKNDACLYTYYLSKKKYTTEHSLLKENLTELIVSEMFKIIKEYSLLRSLVNKQVRKQMMDFVETAVRIGVLLIIDVSSSQDISDRKRISIIFNGFTDILKHFSFNFYLIKLFIPILKPYLHKQVTFQASYVNNTIEYQTFWEDSIVPKSSKSQWSREDLKKLLPMIFYNTHQSNTYFKQKELILPTDNEFVDKVLSAYKCGDSFSFFGLERILVIVGHNNWPLVSIIVNRFFQEYRQTEWFDYSQMSMLYVLFQLTVNAREPNSEILKIFSRECEDWTRRCKGLFKAHNSYKANSTQLYKRNVMNWYCVVYCRHTGDNVAHEGDKLCVPVFYNMIDKALETKDKELLYHLVDNIIELVTDFGYIQTALGLTKYILTKIDTEEKVKELDAIILNRDGVFKENFVRLIGKLLGSAKNYFSKEVDDFIIKDLVGLTFPGIPTYQGELLNYNPGGESLSDLFTHRFGNYLMWALINEEKVDIFAYEAMSAAINQPNSFKWFDNVIKILFRTLFAVNL